MEKIVQSRNTFFVYASPEEQKEEEEEELTVLSSEQGQLRTRGEEEMTIIKAVDIFCTVQLLQCRASKVIKCPRTRNM